MKLSFLTIGTAMALMLFAPAASQAQIECRSPVGGQCINLAAAAANAAVSVPGLEFLGTAESPGAFFSRLYTYGVSLVALVAFFMFTYGAIRYMIAIEGNTAAAKGIMKNAVYGLMLALVSYLILYIINPKLVTEFDINLQKIELTPK